MTEKELKPALCILNPDDLLNLREYGDCPDKIYYCITPHEAMELQKSGISFPSDPHLQEGLVLTREPNGQGYYYRTDETDYYIINKRCLAIESILSYLGGRDFRYSESSSFKSSHNVDVKVDAEFKKTGLDVIAKTDVGTSKNEGGSENTVLVAHWDGKYTKEGYNHAKKLAIENGLESDPEIASLLEQRQPNHPNPIASHEYHVNVTSDLDKSLHLLQDIKANINDKVVGGSLTVNVETTRKIDQSSTVDFVVSFGPIPTDEPVKAGHHRQLRKWIWPVMGVVAIIVIVATLLVLL